MVESSLKMGLLYSLQNSLNNKSTCKENSNEIESITVVYDFTENPIMEDLLIEIFSKMPVKDLILNCRLVCKQWKKIIDSQSVWRLKCEQENIRLPSNPPLILPDNYYRNIYVHATINKRNLILNPCGEDEYAAWHIMHNVAYSTPGFIVEKPPAGADPVPAVVGSQCCFATTYFKCEKLQDVNLRANPINDYLIAFNLVNIRVGEWYAARFDCASQYELKVLLMNADYDIIDSFEFRYEEEQWTGKEWHLVTHEFKKIKHAHYVRFIHWGSDRQFWAGHYGSKMTGAFVELNFK